MKNNAYEMKHVRLFESFIAEGASTKEWSVARWKQMFIKINRDSPKESKFPLSDWEYYAEQIENVVEGEGEEISHAQAVKIAKQLDPESKDKSHLKK